MFQHQKEQNQLWFQQLLIHHRVQQIQKLQQKAAGVKEAENQVNQLLECGLMKLNEDGSIAAVYGFDEQQFILRLRQQEEERDAALQQEMYNAPII